MNPWALVPVKRFDLGKSRLGELLDEEARAALARAMFDRVVSEVLGALVRDATLGGVLVVTDGEEVAARAADRGAAVLMAPGTAPDRQLSRVVDEALAHLHGLGASAALVIMGDLPRLQQGDVRALLGLLEEADVVLAPDEAGAGTNALALRLPAPMPSRFKGGDSLEDHLAEARTRGLRVALCRREGLGFDVDQPADYARLTPR